MSLLRPALFALGALAQTTTYFAPGVPTDQPIPGNYDGVYRPQVHFSPPQYFMNDPNGMHRGPDGTWHLYYQYNPLEAVAGNQHWGHATSDDLYHWTNQKIALFPYNETNFVFSGGAVVDANNTSGMFPDQDNGVVAFYTIANYPEEGIGLQTTNIAFSYDDGYTFETYAENPIINVGSDQYRDPQVVWHAPTERWIMVVSWADFYTIEFYTSENMIDWTPVSNFTDHGLLGIQYECPNLIQMPVEGSDEPLWVLYISINPGAPLGGSIGQYFPGEFNGTHFNLIDGAARIADFGKDNYAAQFFYGVPSNEAQVSMAWASNWQYTSQVPTGETEGWRSQMSLPRRNYLKQSTMIGWVMVSEPYNIEAIFEQELAFNESLGNGSVLVDYSSTSGALYFEANVTGLTEDTLAGNVNFTFSSSVSGESVSGGTFIGAQTWLNRGHANAFSDNVFFTDKFSVNSVYGMEGEWRISGVIDRSIIEIFVNGGEQSATNTFYTNEPLDIMRIGATGIGEDATVSVAVWALESTWDTDSNGTVVGNVTSSGGGNGTSMAKLKF